jgi:hypothetical protein
MNKLTQLHSRTGPSVRSCLHSQLANLKFGRNLSDLKSIFAEHEKIMRDMDSSNCQMSYNKIHSLLESMPRKIEMLVPQFQLMEDEKFQELSLTFVKKKLGSNEISR